MSETAQAILSIWDTLMQDPNGNYMATGRTCSAKTPRKTCKGCFLSNSRDCDTIDTDFPKEFTELREHHPELFL